MPRSNADILGVRWVWLLESLQIARFHASGRRNATWRNSNSLMTPRDLQIIDANVCQLARRKRFNMRYITRLAVEPVSMVTRIDAART